MKRRAQEAPSGAQGKGIAASSNMGQAASAARASLQPTGGLLDWFQASKIKTLLLNVFILYASIPFIIRTFPFLLQKFVFLNFIVYPLWVDYQKPEVYLNHTRNFYLTCEPGITLGIWHSLPDNMREEAEGKGPSWYEEALADDNPIIIYLHGNGGTRAIGHRVRFVKAMTDGGFHVLSIDYRGYADSTGHPSENGFTADTLFVYDWVKARSRNSTVLIWGHSLGTGIATNTARRLKEKDGTIVDALVLEAPYTNIRDAAATIPITKIYRKFPGFEYLILDSMALAEMYFPNDKNVQVLSSPILIIHSEDDAIIPIQQGRKLFEIAYNASEKKENVMFITLPSAMGLGHDCISYHPDIAGILKNFLQSVK
ncbi:protein ABHD12B [Lacerta agilis]|uniref:protein ABHD12B n=1 Tax=Lacerta agilis TaxID=80427 RepID=UPI0014191962|nr:protein ABHD12B [Lacerta agilis]